MAGSAVDLGAQLANGNDSEVYTVFLREGEVYDFLLRGQSAETDGFITDPLMQLSGGPGIPVTITNDDGAEGLDATFTFTPPAGGTGFYQLSVQDTAHVGGLYALEVVNQSLDPDLSDHVFTSGARPDAFGTLTELAQGDVLVTSIAESNDDDVDTVAVALQAGVTYTFTMRGAATGDGTLSDPFMRLLDADGANLVSDAGEQSNASFTFKPTQGGIFFLEGSSQDGSGSYTLQFTAAGASPDVAGNAGTIANLPLGDAIRGDIGAAGEDGSDWYAIHLVAGQQYEFDLARITLSDPGLTLRDANGTVVTQGVDVGAGVDDRIVFTAQTSGLFFLDAHNEGAGAGSYELSGHRLSTGPTPVDAIAAASHDAFVLGSEQADSLAGGSGEDLIIGDGGNDTIGGGGNGDALFGAAGNDSIDGGDGDDLMDGGFGGDTLVGGAGDDEIFGGNPEMELVAGPESDGFDRLFGGIGNDTLDGGVGNDTMLGGAGNDTYVIDSLGDVIGENANEGVDTIETPFSTVLGANFENLTLLGAAALTGTGNALANTIFGNNGINLLNGGLGNDTLNGGAGNDVLVGGAGKDLLTGSGGLDRMVFGSLSDSGPVFAQRDAINTFAHGDHIDLSALDANSKLAGNQAFTFVTNFTHVAGQVQFDQVATNSWFVSADVNGDGVADFSLNVFSAPGFGTLHGFDFIL